MGASVQTVNGEVSVEELGFVLPHEHVLHDMYELTMNSQLILNDRGLARLELQHYKDAGGVTLVDQTVYGMHPDPEGLAEIARDVGLHVIAGTGFYWEKFHPAWLAGMTDREIVELLLKDLTVGFGETRIRAGIIGEIASHHRGISPAELRVFRAVATVQREVPVPIATHALFTRIGLEQVHVLEAAGADLDKVVIGHADTTPDIDYHEELLRTGVWIAYDCVGQLDKQSDEQRADALMELVRRGWKDRLLLSMDIAKRGALRSYGGGGYDYLIRSFLPLLRDRGAGPDLIAGLTRDNPRELFTPNLTV
ncbi:MAG: phosphotriesterase family protein [Gaiellaceae bacterium]